MRSTVKSEEENDEQQNRPQVPRQANLQGNPHAGFPYPPGLALPEGFGYHYGYQSANGMPSPQGLIPPQAFRPPQEQMPQQGLMPQGVMPQGRMPQQGVARPQEVMPPQGLVPPQRLPLPQGSMSPQDFIPPERFWQQQGFSPLQGYFPMPNMMSPLHYLKQYSRLYDCVPGIPNNGMANQPNSNHLPGNINLAQYAAAMALQNIPNTLWPPRNFAARDAQGRLVHFYCVDDFLTLPEYYKLILAGMKAWHNMMPLNLITPKREPDKERADQNSQSNRNSDARAPSASAAAMMPPAAHAIIARSLPSMNLTTPPPAHMQAPLSAYIPPPATIPASMPLPPHMHAPFLAHTPASARMSAVPARRRVTAAARARARARLSTPPHVPTPEPVEGDDTDDENRIPPNLKKMKIIRRQ